MLFGAFGRVETLMNLNNPKDIQGTSRVHEERRKRKKKKKRNSYPKLAPSWTKSPKGDGNGVEWERKERIHGGGLSVCGRHWKEMRDVKRVYRRNEKGPRVVGTYDLMARMTILPSNGDFKG